MLLNFNGLFLNDLKMKIGSDTCSWKYYNHPELENFVRELPTEKKEKAFTISSQAIVQDIHESLTQVLSMTRKNKPERNRFHYYALNNAEKQANESSLGEVEAISVCELSDLLFFSEQPHFQRFVDSIVMLNQRNYQQGLVESGAVTEEELRRFILDQEFLAMKKPVVKVVTDRLNQIFYMLGQVVQGFGQGYKVILSKENEEKLYFSVSNALMYQFNSTGKFVRRSFESYVNKLYSIFLAVAVVLENKLLRKFEKHFKKASEMKVSIAGFHYSGLVFSLEDCDKEERKFEENSEEIEKKSRWLKEKLPLKNKLLKKGSRNFENASFSQGLNFQQEYPQVGYQRGTQYYMQPMQQIDQLRGPYEQVPMQAFEKNYPSGNPDAMLYYNSVNNQGNYYYNYNTNYMSCGFGDEYKRMQSHNANYQDHRPYQYVKMQ